VSWTFDPHISCGKWAPKTVTVRKVSLRLRQLRRWFGTAPCRRRLHASAARRRLRRREREHLSVQDTDGGGDAAPLSQRASDTHADRQGYVLASSPGRGGGASEDDARFSARRHDRRHPRRGWLKGPPLVRSPVSSPRRRRWPAIVPSRAFPPSLTLAFFLSSAWRRLNPPVAFPSSAWCPSGRRARVARGCASIRPRASERKSSSALVTRGFSSRTRYNYRLRFNMSRIRNRLPFLYTISSARLITHLFILKSCFTISSRDTISFPS